ncbi:unnamed protein product [Sphagnum tenellum]
MALLFRGSLDAPHEEEKSAWRDTKTALKRRAPIALPRMDIVSSMASRKRARVVARDVAVTSTVTPSPIPHRPHLSIDSHHTSMFHIPTMEEFHMSALRVHVGEGAHRRRVPSRMISMSRAYSPPPSRKRCRPLSPIRVDTGASLVLQDHVLSVNEVRELEAWATGRTHKRHVYTASPSQRKSDVKKSTYRHDIGTQEQEHPIDDNIAHNWSQITAARKDQTAMRNQIETHVKEIIDWLPPDFLFKMHMEKYVFERGAGVIQDVFSRILKGKLRAAMDAWRFQTEVAREFAFERKYKVVLRKRKAAIGIQCRWRCFVAIKEVTKRVLMLVQSGEASYGSYRRWYKGWKEREMEIDNHLGGVPDITDTSEVLQDTSNELKEAVEFNMRSVAATRIQSLYRGRAARTKVRHWRNEILKASEDVNQKLLEDAQEAYASLMIQQQWRLHVSHETKASSTEVFLDCLEEVLQHTAALRIQYAFHNQQYTHTFQAIVEQIDELLETSVSKIQCHVRSFLARHELIRRRSKFLAARKIQAVVRGHNARIRYKQYLCNATRLVHSLEKVWPNGKRRIVRKRVLKRWRKDNHTTIRKSFRAWRACIIIWKEEKDVKKAKDIQWKANQCFRRTLIKKIWGALRSNVQAARLAKNNQLRAILHSRNKLLAACFSTWSGMAAEATQRRFSLIDIFLLAANLSTWNSAPMIALINKSVTAWRLKWIQRVWKGITSYVRSNREQTAMSIRHYDQHFRRRSKLVVMRTWKSHQQRERRRKIAVKRGNHIVCAATLRQWKENVEASLKEKAANIKANDFYRLTLKEKVVQEWIQLYRHNKEVKHKAAIFWRQSSRKTLFSFGRGELMNEFITELLGRKRLT